MKNKINLLSLLTITFLSNFALADKDADPYPYLDYRVISTSFSHCSVNGGDMLVATMFGGECRLNIEAIGKDESVVQFGTIVTISGKGVAIGQIGAQGAIEAQITLPSDKYVMVRDLFGEYSSGFFPSASISALAGAGTYNVVNEKDVALDVFIYKMYNFGLSVNWVSITMLSFCDDPKFKDSIYFCR